MIVGIGGVRRFEMRGISDTIARLTASAVAAGAFSNQGPTRLQPLVDFGNNPGNLAALIYVPDGLPRNAPLVVVLHGCTQTATGYDRASGWSELADRHGFALLYPEQKRSNNPNGCFNWFEAQDTARGRGEALSIRNMIAAVQDALATDPSRTFVTGLSAGGAMAATMLATYPELFAGGAIIAGLPHGVATGMVEAFDRMRGHGLPDVQGLQRLVRQASDHQGPWPTVSVWHGDADCTVSPGNAEALLAQWRGVHGLNDAPTSIDEVDGAVHRVWTGPDGQTRLEAFIVPGMGHGTPIKTAGAGASGVAAPFMLDVGISSTWRIGQAWELLPAIEDAGRERPEPGFQNIPSAVPIKARRPHDRPVEVRVTRAATGVGKVIEDALRAAGLMR
jgi:poly(hydroxyalkanoate) depolymerase family esterase